MRLLVVCHRWDRERSERGLVRALEQELGARSHEIEHGWPTSGQLAGIDAVVVFIRFRELATMPPLDWHGFDGRRLMLDHDAYQSYVDVAPSRHRGRWPGEFRRHRFDVLLTSGLEVARRLRDDGVTAAWLPKGYDDAYFVEEDGVRAGYCTYGTLYRARAAMVRRLEAARLPLDVLECPYEDLSAALNRHLACLVCNMQARPRLGHVGRLVNRRWPGAFVDVAPGIEPMIKNFEAAATGCAVFADHIPELTELGFIDGTSVIEYRDFDELVDKVRAYGPEDLRRIGHAGAHLCRHRHTWSHRARQLGALLDTA